jgi:glycosyltransferase involved in cell wall biosynthesis
LVKAFSLSKKLNSNFNLVCFGNTIFTKNEIDFFKSEKINLSKIKIISGNDYHLNYLYKKASLYVCPSIYEGFGLTLLEAMNMNCPIIASETSSIKEVGENVIEIF